MSLLLLYLRLALAVLYAGGLLVILGEVVRMRPRRGHLRLVDRHE